MQKSAPEDRLPPRAAWSLAAGKTVVDISGDCCRTGPEVEITGDDPDRPPDICQIHGLGS